MHWEFLQEALANAQGPTETANDPSLPSVTTTLTDGSPAPKLLPSKITATEEIPRQSHFTCLPKLF